MKKLIRLLVVVLLIGCFSNVKAQQHDVVAKYSEMQNIVTYDGVISNGESSIQIDTGVVKVKSNISSLEGVNVVIIKTTGDALNWIKKYSNSEDNYYIYFNKDNKEVNVSDKIEIDYVSFDNLKKELAVYNTNGSIVSRGNGSATCYNTNFYISITEPKKVESAKHTLNLNIGEHGKVMIDGVFYEKESSYSTSEESIKIAIMANKGFAVESISYDNEDISSSVQSGFVTLKLNKENTLNIIFSQVEEEIADEVYTISGKVVIDGEPIIDAVVLLNDQQKTITNSKGEYKFENVPIGVNSLLIMKDGKGIGFATFKLVAGDVDEIEAYDDGDEFVIAIGANNLTFAMDLNINSDYSIAFDNIEISSNSNFIWLLVLGGIVVLGVVVVFVIFRKK